MCPLGKTGAGCQMGKPIINNLNCYSCYPGAILMVSKTKVRSGEAD